MQRKMISLLGAAGLMAMTTAAVCQNNTTRGDAPPPRNGHGRGVGGQVSAVDAKAGTITVASRWDETQTIKVGPSAKILARKDSTVGSLKVGDTIQVSGVFSQLTALSIQSGELPDGPPPPMDGAQRGRGARGGRPGGDRPGAFGGPERDMGGPGGPPPMDGPDGPSAPGEDGPPMDGGPRADASAGDQDAPRVRGRHLAASVRNTDNDAPGRPPRPADDLGRDSGPGTPGDFDEAQGPPPPAGRFGDGPMGDGPGGGGGPRDEERRGGPRGGGMMDDGPRGGGRDGDDLRGGPRGERPMGGPRGGLMGGNAHLSGKITSLSPLTIAVSDSLSLVIKTDSKTHVTQIVTESLSDIKKGDRIFAAVGRNGETLTAKSVSVNLEP